MKRSSFVLGSLLMVVAAAMAVRPGMAERGTQAVASVAPASSFSAASCPAEMVHVHGSYCPDVTHTCLRWMDPPGRYHHYRCAIYDKPVCRGERVSMSYCIDRDEYTAPGERLPAVQCTWLQAKATCERLGKRLCEEGEWQFACEGDEMLPYPYGFERDSSACNIDRSSLGVGGPKLVDLRAPAGSHARCTSPFGVRDLSGNVEEWVVSDPSSDARHRSSLKGAWWLPGRSHCRAATRDHGERYQGAEVGFRCCRDS